MAGEWIDKTLEELTEPTERAFAMGPFGSNIRSENYRTSGIPVIRGSNLADAGGPVFINSNFVFLSEDKADELSSSCALPGDLVFVAQGTVGRVGLVPTSGSYKRYVLSQNLMKATVSSDISDPAFVFYYFRSQAGQHEILSRVNPTGVPCISRPLSSLRTFRVPVPPLSEQHAIARILGRFDDKIELNRRMNETLEAMGRALFKSWFVDFDPVGAKAEGRDPGLPKPIADLFPARLVDSELGEIPEGWTAGTLGAVGQPTIGGDWGEDEPFAGAVEGNCLRGVDLEHLRSEGHCSAPRRWFSAASLYRRAMDERDVLIAGSGAGPTGRPLWMCGNLLTALSTCVYSNFCKRIRCGSAAKAVYLDSWLHGMRGSGEIWDYVNGTSVPNLDVHSLLAGKEIPIPPVKILDQYYDFVRPIWQKKYSGENHTLATLRDTLLPKLISGELRVKDAERVTAEVAV
jgi:type I restriction enzyme, S subunit